METHTNAQQSPFPSLDIEVRPLDQLILGLLLGGLGYFFLNIFYNTVQPDLPSKASSVHRLKTFSSIDF